MYFHFFVIVSPRKSAWPFIGTNLKPLHPRMLCAISLVEIGTIVLEKKICQCIFAFYNFLPLEKGVALHLKKIESPSSKDAFIQVWLKLVPWCWRRFLNFINVFTLFHDYLSLEKGMDLHLKRLELRSPMVAL